MLRQLLVRLLLVCVIAFAFRNGLGQSVDLGELNKDTKPKEVIQGATGGTRMQDLTAGLRIMLSTNRREYKLGEPILVDFRIYNGGRQTKYVYNEIEKEGWLVIFELREKKTGKPVYQSSPAKVPSRGMRDSFYIALPAGATVGRFYAIGLPNQPFPEGEYELQASYTNTYETCLASLHFSEEDINALGKGAFVRLWTGRLLSEAIPLAVTKGKSSKSEAKKKGSRSKDRAN